jgi:fucose permease
MDHLHLCFICDTYDSVKVKKNMNIIQFIVTIIAIVGLFIGSYLFITRNWSQECAACIRKDQWSRQEAIRNITEEDVSEDDDSITGD